MRFNRKFIEYLLAAMLVVFVGYFLSEGYFYRLERTSRISYKKYYSMYGPIVWLNCHNNWFGDFYGWYDELWYSDYEHMKAFVDSLPTNSPATSGPIKILPSGATNQP